MKKKIGFTLELGDVRQSEYQLLKIQRKQMNSSNFKIGIRILKFLNNIHCIFYLNLKSRQNVLTRWLNTI